MSAYLDESQELIKFLFDLAKQEKPSIIFIDEIDLFCKEKNENPNSKALNIKNQFIKQIDNITDNNVFVICATAYHQAIDPVVVKMFEKKIYTRLPEFKERLNIMKEAMKETKHSLSN